MVLSSLMGPKCSTGEQAGNAGAQEHHPQTGNRLEQWAAGWTGTSHSLTGEPQPGQAELLGTCGVAKQSLQSTGTAALSPGPLLGHFSHDHTRGTFLPSLAPGRNAFSPTARLWRPAHHPMAELPLANQLCAQGVRAAFPPSLSESKAQTGFPSAEQLPYKPSLSPWSCPGNTSTTPSEPFQPKQACSLETPPDGSSWPCCSPCREHRHSSSSLCPVPAAASCACCARQAGQDVLQPGWMGTGAHRDHPMRALEFPAGRDQFQSVPCFQIPPLLAAPMEKIPAVLPAVMGC